MFSHMVPAQLAGARGNNNHLSKSFLVLSSTVIGGNFASEYLITSRLRKPVLHLFARLKFTDPLRWRLLSKQNPDAGLPNWCFYIRAFS